MIDKLTKEQAELIPVYRDKWLKIGLCTDPVERDLDLPNEIRTKILKLNSSPTVYMDSPLSAWLAVCLLAQNPDKVMSQVGSQVGSQVESQVMSQVMSQVRSQVESQVRSQVRSQVGSQVGPQVMSQVGSQVRSQVGSQVRSQVGSQVGPQVRSQVWSQVESQVMSQVGSQVGSQVESFVWPYIDGHFFASWFSFIDYMKSVLGVRLNNLYNLYEKTTQFGLFYPLKHVTVISDRPCEIHMVDGRLHRDGGPSILYRDGFSVWSLNGVQVTKEIAETPAEQLDPKLLIKEENAEVKREILRKIGVSRTLQKLEAKRLDGWREYELYCINNIDIEPVHIVKMRCPSTGTYYALRTPPEIKQAREAIKWINHGVDPEAITVST